MLVFDFILVAKRMRSEPERCSATEERDKGGKQREDEVAHYETEDTAYAAPDLAT